MASHGVALRTVKSVVVAVAVGEREHWTVATRRRRRRRRLSARLFLFGTLLLDFVQTMLQIGAIVDDKETQVCGDAMDLSVKVMRNKASKCVYVPSNML
jgi:hypothetical protein